LGEDLTAASISSASDGGEAATDFSDAANASSDTTSDGLHYVDTQTTPSDDSGSNVTSGAQTAASTTLDPGAGGGTIPAGESVTAAIALPEPSPSVLVLSVGLMVLVARKYRSAAAR
jgi:hypothetical protein